MARNQFPNLKSEFPDLSESVVAAIVDQYKEDANSARNALQNLVTEDESQQSHNQKKIRELQEQFGEIPVEIITQVLKENNWDVDECLVPLFNKLEEVRAERKRKLDYEQRKKRDEEERKRRQEEVKKQSESLMEIFQNIPKETIQKLLDENEGDIDETINQLSVLVTKQEEAKKEEIRRRAREEEKNQIEEQEKRMRQIKIDALKEKFQELTEQDVTAALEKEKWDIKEACKLLMVLSTEKKKNELKMLFPTFNENEIHNALDENEWNTIRAAKVLTAVREARRQQEIELLQKKQETSKSQDKQQSQSKQKEPVINITKVQQSILEKSILIGNEVENEIAREEESKKKQQREEVQEKFRQELNHIITTQAQQNGLPGLVPPPLPKQIDDLLGKKRPVDESDEQSNIQQHKPMISPDKASPVTESQEQHSIGKKEGLNVILKALPSVIDTGNTITVEWETNNLSSSTLSSSSYDWIGFYRTDQPNKQYITYEWRGKNDKKGYVTFTAPSQYGEYEFRYFPYGSYEHIGMSNRIIVGPQVTVDAVLDQDAKKIRVKWNQKSGNQYRRCWIGLYNKNNNNNKDYISWEYGNTPGCEILFDSPIKPGDYELRFFSYGYYDVARSDTIRIDGADKIDVDYVNNTITVKLNIVTVDPYADNAWVGVFFTNENDNRRWRRYKYLQDRVCNVTFKAPSTAGQYEVRVFANKSYDTPIIVSKSFQIPQK